MKKISRFLICLTLLMSIVSFPLVANADTGPKPSVVVKFNGISDETYYATLLSEVDSTGPWSHDNEYEDYMGEESVFRKFADYDDADGYYFLGFMDECTEDHSLKWGYYPPERFKVLLYFPESDLFSCSADIYERYAFDSYYSITLSAAGINETGDIISAPEMIVQKSYNFSQETLSLMARIILTIAVEIGIALLFGYRNRKSLKIIVITNIITQIVLNVLLNLINFHGGQRTFLLNYIWMEVVVFLIEAKVYSKWVDGKAVTFKRAVPYALLANVVSLIVGIAVAKVIPGIF